MQTSRMKEVGKTSEGHPVVNGVFTLVGTHGLPLEVVLEFVKGKGWLVSWPHYVTDAMKDGAKMKSIRAKVMAAVGEVYGPKYVSQLSQRWDDWFELTEKK